MSQRVLVVDDEPQIRRALRLVLRANGYDVAEVGTGEGALDALVIQPFDLMILDLMLPDVDGVEVCRRLREWSHLPVVVLSAHGEEEVKVCALDEGAETEYDLLRVLTTEVGRVITHGNLLRTVMGRGYEDATGTLRVHIASLRKKLEANPARPRIIVTEPGIGYRLQVD